MASRLLTREERRLLVDALRAAAAEARRAKASAIAGATIVADPKIALHIDELSRRAGTLDRLAAEANEHELRLERLSS